MYQIPELLRFPRLFHAFSTKADSNMANSILGKVNDFNQVLINRKKFLDSIDIFFDDCICLWVIGKDGVSVARPKDAGVSISNYKKAVRKDALITNKSGLYLFMLIADCAPVIIYDPVNNALGLVHVGWKGANLEIVNKVIKRLSDLYGTQPEDLIVGIGPAARKESFIKENPSQKDDPKWSGFITPADKNFYKVDFVGLCKKQLVESGMKHTNIFDSGIDTVTDNRFFSHVLEGKLPLSSQGRFACVVGIRPL